MSGNDGVIYTTLEELAAAVQSGLSKVTTIGRPTADTPAGSYAWVEPYDNDEAEVPDGDHATGGTLYFRVQVRTSGVDLQDKMRYLCNVVDRTRDDSVQRALIGSAAAIDGRLTIKGSRWGIDPVDSEWGATVTGCVLLLPAFDD